MILLCRAVHASKTKVTFGLTRALLLAYLLLLTVYVSRAEGLVSKRFRFDEQWQCPTLYPTLFCEDIKDLKIVSWIAQGTVKNVYLARWHDYPVVLSNLTVEAYREDFQHNVAMHHLLDYGQYTVRMLGHCGDQIVTEFHPLGNLMQAIPVLGDVLEVRFPLCIRYTEILVFLHQHGRVMCDSSTLEKTLEQYLVATSGSIIILNDLDALPRKELGVVRCGKHMLDGAFVAPEQRWEVGYRKGYNEKADVYKIPDVCNFILGESEESLWFRYWLFDIHKQCKVQDASIRPSAKDVLKMYRRIWREYQTDTGVDYDDL